MRCVRSPAHLRPRTRAYKLAFTPQIVIDTNSPAHAESSPHVRRTLDINRESDIHAVAGTLQTPISIHALREESDCAAGHFCPLFETQASCLALRISNNTASTTNNIPKTSNWLSVSFLISTI